MSRDVVFKGTGLGVSYGGVIAVNDVSITIERGEVVGLIGPNGAGKTSFIDGVSGFARMTGSSQLLGQELGRLRAHQRNRLGLSRTWQSVALFADLTIRENITVALSKDRARRRGQADGRVDSVLERINIMHLAERLPGELSHGQQVLAGVARAVAASPVLVLMDEPGAGLDDAEARELGTIIRGLATDGISILLVDHDMDLVLDVSDRIYVLDFGRLVATGSPRDIANDPAVIAAYLGGASHEQSTATAEGAR